MVSSEFGVSCANFRFFEFGISSLFISSNQFDETAYFGHNGTFGRKPTAQIQPKHALSLMTPHPQHLVSDVSAENVRSSI